MFMCLGWETMNTIDIEDSRPSSFDRERERKHVAFLRPRPKRHQPPPPSSVRGCNNQPVIRSTIFIALFSTSVYHIAVFTAQTSPA